MKDAGGDYNLYGYELPEAGDSTYWDAESRNPSALARDLWLIPLGNNTVAMTELDANVGGEQELAVLKLDHGFDQNIYFYNVPVPGDWALLGRRWAEPLGPCEEFWTIPAGNDTILMADGGSRIASHEGSGRRLQPLPVEQPCPGRLDVLERAREEPLGPGAGPLGDPAGGRLGGDVRPGHDR